MISIAFICLLFSIARSQPANNHPCNAFEITGSLPLRYEDATNLGADELFELSLPDCPWIYDGKSAWYKINRVSSLFIQTAVHPNVFINDPILSLWTAEQCDDPATFTCIKGDDDCFELGLAFGSCVDAGVDECYDEVYIQLHGWTSPITTYFDITGTRNVLGCDDCGHTWNTGPNKEVQCVSDDMCCPGLSCNSINGKCNLPGSGGQNICGHIQNSGPNKELNCNDPATFCCDGFVCNQNNGKCLKKKLKNLEVVEEAIGNVLTSTQCAGYAEDCKSKPDGCCSGVCHNTKCGRNDIVYKQSESDESSIDRDEAKMESNHVDENNMYHGYDDDSGENNMNLIITNIWAMFAIFLFVILCLFYFHKRFDKKF